MLVWEDPVSVLLNFGKNLRKLCTTRPTIAHVCRDLDINRVQFNRYMSGHSFPKPNVLDSICRYFDVDARIYVDELTDQQIEALKRGESLKAGWSTASYLGQAGDFMDRGADLAVSQAEIPDGIHRVWRHSFRDETMTTCTLFQLSTENGVRLLKGYDPILGYTADDHIVNQQTREYRGVAVAASDGYSLIYISPDPSNIVGYSFFGRIYFADNMFGGYTVLGRNEYVGKRRMSRSILELLPQNRQAILEAARLSSKLFSMNRTPTIIAKYLNQPF